MSTSLSAALFWSFSLGMLLLSGCSGGAAAPSGSTCQDIRTCVWYCATPTTQPCVNDCIAKGTPAARSTFQALAACTAPLCPADDSFSYCVNCEQRCFGDGQCLGETAACLGGTSPDIVCEELCR